MKKNNAPKVIVLRTAGTNCDQETAFAFRHWGAVADLVHVNRLVEGRVKLNSYHILAVPGGFTYGDDIISGRILANELKLKLGGDIESFISQGKLVIGICNGFQVLVRSGILPGEMRGAGTVRGTAQGKLTQTVSLTYNDSGKFEDRWVSLEVTGNSPWTKGLRDVIFLPVAHAEGKFVTQSESTLDNIRANGQVAFRYTSLSSSDVKYPENPNGSVDNISGITDSTGRILGMMPHPERHFFFTQHPNWTRLKRAGNLGHGAKIFENGVNYVKENLL